MDQFAPNQMPNMAVPLDRPIMRDASQPVVNPLLKHFRQPAIYMRLPSGGKYWPDGSVDLGKTGELAVYPMTTKDEITLRTPDALMNGQGVIEVILSCVPGIKDPWQMPSIDVDSVLISLRIASYGHEMDFESKCPHCGDEHSYKMDLRSLLETIQLPNYDQLIELGPLAIKWRPQSYYHVNQSNQINYEVQRMNQAVESLNDTDAEKQSVMKAQLDRLIELNFDVLTRCTEYIIDQESTTKVHDPAFIKEFYKNVDSKTLKTLQDQLTELVKVANVQPQKVNCGSCNGEIDLEILFDYTNFFVVGF